MRTPLISPWTCTVSLKEKKYFLQTTSFLPWVWVGFNEYNRFGAMIRTL
jgi:hypothetical protein